MRETTMIELKYNQLSGMNFLQTVQKLVHERLAVQAAYNIKKIADDIQRARKQIGEQYRKELVDAFAKRDENGQVVWTSPDQTDFEVMDGKEEEFRKALTAFGEKVFVMDRTPISLHDLRNCLVSAAELTVLEPIMVLPSDQNGEKVVSLVPPSA
jgi:hypothetical protein